jgi:hypothetical protein
MDQEILNNAVSKGLPMPFAITKAGATVVAEPTAAYKEQLAQIALVIFETIGALGEVKISTIEVVGDKKSVIMDLDPDGLVGTIYETSDGKIPDEYWKVLRGLRAKPAVTVPVSRKALVDPSILETIKAILQDYVGDFTERIFQNQMKNQDINVEELHAEDVRRLILALSKATSMIVGRKKGRDLSSKLIELVR